MTDIFIKSFNRPYYLDRCITSIKTFVSGCYQVTVLDDGTPEKYLNKIQRKHPEIIVRRSDSYQDKTKAIEENLASGKDIDGFQIPTSLWYEAAENASPYFIMTEDDVWFTHPIDIDELSQQAHTHNIRLIKLGWLGNYSDDQSLILKPMGNTLTALIPQELFLAPPIIMDWFFYNKYKFFTLLYKLGFVNNKTKLKYWALNSILMGFYQKDYWLSIWKDARGKVDEKQQLRNAALYYRKHRKEDNFVTRLNTETMKTTFKSSATNSYHQYGHNFDVNYFNHLMNEAWYRDTFSSMEGFPSDFPTKYFEQFLDSRIDPNEMRAWIKQFEKQYKNLGCDVS